MAEYVKRCILCEVLGFSTAEFGHIKAINLTQDAKTLHEKRIGKILF